MELKAASPTIALTTQRWLLVALYSSESAAFVLEANWPYEILAGRMGDLSAVTGVGLRSDLSFVLGQMIYTLTGYNPAISMIMASMMAAPCLALLVARTTPASQNKWVRSILLTTHPLSLTLFIAGYGWATVGLYGLWRLLAELPAKAPHQGMPLAGIGIGGAFLTVPQFSVYLMPVAAVLFMCAPRTMLSRHMRVFYLLSFAPVTMIAASLAYSEWLFGGEGTIRAAAPLLLGGWSGLSLVLLASLVVAPGLMRVIGIKGGAARLSVLLILVLTASAEPMAATPLLGAAAIAQGAIAVRHGEPIFWTVSSLFGGLLAIFLLDRLPHLA